MHDTYNKEFVRKKLPIYCGTLAIAIIFCFLLGFLTIKLLHVSLFKANRQDAFDTAQALAYSLAYNKLDTVKTYVSEEKWGFLDSWSSIHSAVSPSCKPWDNPSGTDAIGSSSTEDPNTYRYAYWIDYDCPQYSYTFFIDVNLSSINREWKITEWYEICETKGADKKCYE